MDKLVMLPKGSEPLNVRSFRLLQFAPGESRVLRGLKPEHLPRLEKLGLQVSDLGVSSPRVLITEPVKDPTGSPSVGSSEDPSKTLITEPTKDPTGEGSNEDPDKGSDGLITEPTKDPTGEDQDSASSESTGEDAQNKNLEEAVLQRLCEMGKEDLIQQASALDVPYYGTKKEIAERILQTVGVDYFKD